MRFVIYDDESMEPITVLNLPLTERDALDRAWNGERWRLAVPVNFEAEIARQETEPTDFHPLQTVDIWFEVFVRKGRRSPMCFTSAAELAMLLNPAWLPGQRSAVDYLQEQNDRLTRMLMGQWATGH